MISKEHRKHSKLAKVPYGNFGLNEFAILGATCETIRSLSQNIIQALSPKYKCAYIDSQHTDDRAATSGTITSGAATEYVNHVHYGESRFNKTFTPFQYRQLFSDCDIILVNGNHYEAKNQVLIIDETKKESLKKRLAQLTNVQLILFNSDIEIFDFIKEHLPSWQQIPVYALSDHENIISFFKLQMRHAEPLLNGLVLAGGKSERFGYDKGKISWHGNEQRYHIADMLGSQCKEVFISCRAEQQHEIDAAYKTLPDTFTGLGPYGAILSALREQPTKAWLVVACDLPLIDAVSLEYLIQNRDVSKIATTYESPHDSLPEPLITIWEPKSYPVLLSSLSQSNSCPRKALINNDIRMIKALDANTLINVNTIEDSEQVKNILERRTVT